MNPQIGWPFYRSQNANEGFFFKSWLGWSTNGDHRRQKLKHKITWSYTGIESLIYKSFHLPWQLPFLQLWRFEAHCLGTFHLLRCDPWECRLRESHYGAVVELVWGRRRAGSVSAARVLTFVSASNWSWHCGDVEGCWEHEVIHTTS